jgi:putative peptidoglycan lipid II flippase
VLHLAIQLPDLLRLAGRRYFPTLGLGDPTVREVAKLMGPRLVGVAAVQVNFVINAMVATALGEGSLTAINIARMVMTMPLYAIAQSVATAALPTFSAQVARGELGQMRASLAATLRGVLLLSVPAMIGLILLREPVTAMLFQYGKFDAKSTTLVAWALLWFTAGLIGHSVVEILSRAFYALHDTKTPVLVGTAAMVLNALFSFTFPAAFVAVGWLPLGGIALANSLATALEGAALLVLMHRRLHGLDGPEIAKGLGQISLASLAMALALVAWTQLSAGRNHWLVGLGGVAIGGIIYLLGVIVLRVPEIRSLMGWVKNRLARAS